MAERGHCNRNGIDVSFSHDPFSDVLIMWDRWPLLTHALPIFSRSADAFGASFSGCSLIDPTKIFINNVSRDFPAEPTNSIHHEVALAYFRSRVAPKRCCSRHMARGVAKRFALGRPGRKSFVGRVSRRYYSYPIPRRMRTRV